MIPLLFAVTTAWAADETPLTGHAGHATTLGPGHGVVGLFRPWAIGVSDKVDLGTTGPSALVAPKVDVKVSVFDEQTDDQGTSLAVTGGLGLPSVGLSFLRGTVLTSDPTQSLGFAAIGELGVVGTLRQRRTVTSLGAELRVGAQTGNLAPVDLFFVGPMLAPVTEGPALRLRWVTDYPLAKRLVLTSDFAVQLGSTGPDMVARGFFLGGVSDHVALGAGWAVAAETLSFGGKDSWGVPLLDLQGRW